MKHVDFELHPFTRAPSGAVIVLTGSIHRDGEILHLAYRLQGPLKELSIPPAAQAPQRRHELWKETCFEGFIQPAGSSAYWELNLSPAGHWNLYHFDGYRQGMREEPLATELSVNVREIEGALALSTEVDLGAFGSGDLKIGVSAVIRARDGHLAYWALTHPDTQPDFHHSRSFVLGL
jgi:hypothetical protein